MPESELHWESAQEGAELIRDGDHDGAIAMLNALLVSEPDNEYAYYFLGAAYYELEQYDRALKCYVKALELAPTYVGAMINAGHSLRMMGRYSEAIRMARQVLARQADDPDALFLVGASSFARGEDVVGRAFLERYLQTNPELEIATEVQGMLQVIEERSPTQTRDPDDDDVN